MRHLRPYLALLAIAAMTTACSSGPGASSGGGNSQGGEPSSGSQPSQAAASTGGGGGGGGGVTGANGGLSYEVTGDVNKSGELDFAYLNGGVSQFANGGWVAYFTSEDQNTAVQINSNPDTSIVNYGDGEIVVVGTSETGCTFDFSQNDESGLKGTIDCADVIAANAAGAQINVDFHATVDAHT